MKKLILNIALLTATTVLINFSTFAETIKTKSTKADTTNTKSIEKKNAEVKNEIKKGKASKETNIYRMENPYKYIAKKIQIA